MESPKKTPAASTGLFGPYPLNDYEIGHNLFGGKIGVYALGYTAKDGIFYVDRIGRSDKDLTKELVKFEGMYKEFKFIFFATPKSAYAKECELYHAFTPRDNISHPAKPKDSNLKCAVCGL